MTRCSSELDTALPYNPWSAGHDTSLVKLDKDMCCWPGGLEAYVGQRVHIIHLGILRYLVIAKCSDGLWESRGTIWVAGVACNTRIYEICPVEILTVKCHDILQEFLH